MSWLDQVRGWVLDLDGCLVRTRRAGGTGGTLIAGAVELVDALGAAGHRVLICTNASELAPRTYADHLRELGLPVRNEDFVTAGSAGADHIASHHPGATVVAVGGSGIVGPMLDRGLSLFPDREPHECAAVFVGGSSSYSHVELNAACLAVEAGAAFYVSQNQPWFQGGAGRSIATSGVIGGAITWVTGVEPTVTGKPSPVLAEALLERLGLSPDQVAVVGDAAAEIRLARAMGARSIAVLSGALTPDKITGLGSELRPDLVVADVSELHHHLNSLHPHITGVLP